MVLTCFMVIGCQRLEYAYKRVQIQQFEREWGVKTKDKNNKSHKL